MEGSKMEKDISQKLLVRSLLSAVISSDTVTFSAVVDTQDIQSGLMMAVIASAFTDGVYAVAFQKADDLAFTTNVNTIPDEQIVGSIADIVAATAAGDPSAAVGILSLKDPSALQAQRFVRAAITSTGTTSGATLSVTSVEHLDLAPAA
jgi:hypothetical protein